MDEDRKEWIEFQRNATEALRRGSMPDSTGTLSLLQLLVLPCFDQGIAWELFQRSFRSKPDSFYGTRMIWRRDIDGEKFRNPVERLKHPRTLHPTIETSVIDLSSAFVTSILDRFRSLTIPAYVESKPIWLDGTGYEISLGSGLSGARYYWSNNGPPEWKPLLDAALATLKELYSAADSGIALNGSW